MDLWFTALSLHKVHRVGHILMLLLQLTWDVNTSLRQSGVVFKFHVQLYLFSLRYYPYHYAPFMSDLKQFSGQPPKEFELGEPMFPLHQLLAKLHPASSALLPKAYQVTDTM